MMPSRFSFSHRVSRALRQRRRAQRRWRRAKALAENAELRALLATLVPLSGRYTVKPQGTGLRPAPENKGTADLVPGGTIVTVTGQKGNWLRIVLDDGREGFSQRFLLDPVVGTPGPAAQAAQVAQAPEATEVELAVWNSVKDTTLPAELEAYLAIYPNGVFAPLARIRLGALRGTPNAEAAAKRRVTGRLKRRVTGRPKRRVTGKPKRRVTGRPKRASKIGPGQGLRFPKASSSSPTSKLAPSRICILTTIGSPARRKAPSFPTTG